MSVSTVSSKYQVVIPKEVRRKLRIKPGQTVRFEAKKNGDITIKTITPLEELRQKFGGRNIWGKDPVETIRKMRDEWDD